MKDKEELKELKLKSVNDLHRLLAISREKLRDLRFKVSQNQLKNIREIRQVRKKIIRILTLINQLKGKEKEGPVKEDKNEDKLKLKEKKN